MAKKMNGAVQVDDLEAQRNYVKELKESGFDFPLIAAMSFVEGMRDSGYRNTATALDEFIDNAVQAGAGHIYIVTGYDRDNNTQKKPDQIAVVDDGHGMDPDTIRLAVLWGGTHRFNDRTGFGRFGFGLPSAAVAVARRYTVYSKVDGGEWFAVTVDLDEIAASKYTDHKGVVRAPAAKKLSPPEFVRLHCPIDKLEHGTVIVLEKTDRLSPGFNTSESFTRKMLEHLGLIYRGLLRSHKLFVVDTAGKGLVKEVEPVDPLFVTPGARFYDSNPKVIAEELPETRFEVKDRAGKESLGVVRIRYSRLPGGFQESEDGRLDKGRFNVMDENNGLIIMRSGRQVDVVARNPWTTFVNYDRNWAIEISFDPKLDEEFGVTTNKQQITISDRMWQLLEENGVSTAIAQLRKRNTQERAEQRSKTEKNEVKLSEQIATEAEKYQEPVPVTQEQEEKSKQQLKEEVERKKRETGKPEPEIVAEILGHPYKVEYETLPGAPFYRMIQVGGQRRLYVNMAHRFYTDVYEGAETSPRVKAALELLLMVLGACEVEASGDRERFYVSERSIWSRRLGLMLDLLESKDSAQEEEDAQQAERETVKIEKS